MSFADAVVGGALSLINPAKGMPVTKAALEIEGMGGKDEWWELQYNPATLGVSKTATWNPNKPAGNEAPTLVYTGSGSASITFEFYLDVTRPEGVPDGVTSVTPATNRLMTLLRPLGVSKISKDDIHVSPGNSRPPLVRLHWGENTDKHPDHHTLWCVVTNLQISYQYFSRAGDPLRAKVNMTLTQAEGSGTELAYQNPTSHTPYPHSLHYPVAGESLDRIAARRYGDSTRWRAIARANGIANPFQLDPNRPLIIPDDPAVLGA